MATKRTMDIWFCDKCGKGYASEYAASICCKQYHCSVCGIETPRYITKCDSCRNKELFEKAQKMTWEEYEEKFPGNMLYWNDEFYSDLGDLLDATEDIIVQQVNCRSVMGSGVAKAIYTRWPEVKTEYHKFCRRSTSPYDLLGKVQLIDVEPGKAVANVFGQLNYGRTAGKVYTDYVALTKAFDQLRTAFHDKSLAFPYNFGCGLANGSWSVVYKMICTYFNDMDVTIYKLPISEEGEIAA